MSLSVAEDGTNGQEFYENADKFAGAYEDSTITIISVNSWITYDGMRRYVKPGVSVPFTTSGTNATSWATDSSKFTSAQSSADVGNVIADTVAMFGVTEDYSAFRSRGFYSAGDGGGGLWVATGNSDTTKSGTHVPELALIYNANGTEYKLVITSENVNVASNGAKEVSGTTALTTDDFVCIGDVFEGIMSVYGYPYIDDGYSVVHSGNLFNKIEVFFPGKFYRIGKQSIKLRSGTSIDSAGALITLSPHSDYTYAKTGVRIDGISTKENAAYWRGITTSWDLSSWNNAHVKNITLAGDHKPSVTRDSCTGGIGANIINPQHVTFENVVIHGWLMDSITREWNAHIPSSWGKVTSNMTYINQLDDSSTTQQGHFYGVTWINCEFLGSRDGTMINLCDWSTWIDGNIFNQYNWLNGVDATAPLYTVWQMGAGWNKQGGQVGVYHDDTGSSSSTYPYTYAPQNATIYDICKQVDWGTGYSEWNKNFLEVGALGYTYGSSESTTGLLANTQRYTGLKIAFDTTFKPNKFSTLVKFSAEMFGAFSGSDDSGWTWTDGVTFSRGDVARALSQFTVGSPVADEGAFLHGGYDFRYGTYNLGFYNNVTPDVDSTRGTRDKEFLNDLGLINNGLSLMAPLVNPAYDSNIVIWYKDHTGNFDPTNIVMNEQSYIDGSTMTNVYTSTGNLLFDYGNGWKAAVVRNLRPFGYSEERGWSPQNYLRITTTSSTPITLKAIQAFKGGVPIYPMELKPYIPMSQNNGVFGTQTSLTNCDLYPNKLGGGMFQIGDKVATWSYLKHNGRFTFTQDTGTYGYPQVDRIVSAVGNAGSSYTASTLSATVISVGAKSTVVEFSSSDVLRVFLGLPIYISSSTGTVTAGRYNLANRIFNSDGTLTNQYTIAAVIGAAGDVLTIDNSKMSYDFQPTQVPYLQTSGWVNIGSTLTVGNLATFKGKVVMNTEATLLGYNVCSYGVIAPTSSTSTGVKGQIASDSTYIYLCVAANTWVRTPITTW